MCCVHGRTYASGGHAEAPQPTSALATCDNEAPATRLRCETRAPLGAASSSTSTASSWPPSSSLPWKLSSSTRARRRARGLRLVQLHPLASSPGSSRATCEGFRTLPDLWEGFSEALVAPAAAAAAEAAGGRGIFSLVFLTCGRMTLAAGNWCCPRALRKLRCM